MLVITRRNESAFGPVQRELFCGEINKFESPSLRSYLSHHTLPRPRIHQRNPCSRKRRSGDAIHHHSSDFVSRGRDIALWRRTLSDGSFCALAERQQHQCTKCKKPSPRASQPTFILHGSFTTFSGDQSPIVCFGDSSPTTPLSSYLRINSEFASPSSSSSGLK